uniref:Uncharacterized protein n=1 Tax=Percolomonas cosmopolitus TaxID=63605 RepID=A0A7S1KPD6_9EUKA|mmetsp:Transcript_3916/g.14826  ORF Transcript_3916/g.14826 Transcript_3916/m.14826 type:complete len:1028 (+) Transcript_3916:91-3174(+)|eukprot:CAMPEP_0117445736 /NCGR_PEP_ID=MMETSP0759-20121206/5957_1 /TAXON_ID=63605 /ORGANISM="Percolomonas cosmopolitus, Strain WS" /LENGTH=1027 /DNA_ID=CAMNT_0005237937 /DNA_START=51 /DNA_END=3134 /DNA_ORIENTATION=+
MPSTSIASISLSLPADLPSPHSSSTSSVNVNHNNNKRRRQRPSHERQRDNGNQHYYHHRHHHDSTLDRTAVASNPTTHCAASSNHTSLAQSKLHQYQSQILFLSNLLCLSSKYSSKLFEAIHSPSSGQSYYEKLIILELERVLRQVRINNDGISAGRGDHSSMYFQCHTTDHDVDVPGLNDSNVSLQQNRKSSRAFGWSVLRDYVMLWFDTWRDSRSTQQDDSKHASQNTPQKRDTPQRRMHNSPVKNTKRIRMSQTPVNVAHLHQMRMRQMLDSPNMIEPSPSQFPTTPIFQHDPGLEMSPTPQNDHHHFVPFDQTPNHAQTNIHNRSSQHSSHTHPSSQPSISSRSYWKLVTMPLLLHTALALIQIYCSIRLSAKSAKLTRHLMDHRFRSFLWNVADSAMLSTFVSVVASTKESLRLRMTTEILLHSVRKSCVDIFHYELQKAWARKYVQLFCSGLENILGMSCYSIALARLTGIATPSLLVSYVVLQKIFLRFFRPQAVYNHLHCRLHDVFMRFADFLWKDEHTDVKFYETTKRAHPRNSREQVLRMFTEFCSIQSKLYRLDLVYRDIFGGFLQRNMPLIVSWTYTAVLVSLGNMKFMTYAELASLFRFMGALISHQIRSTNNVASLTQQHDNLHRLGSMVTAWQHTYAHPQSALVSNNQTVALHNGTSTVHDLSLSTISLALITPTKNYDTVIEAIRCASAGPVPNLHSSLSFTPQNNARANSSGVLQLDAQRLSLTSNLQQSAEWIIDYCIRTDMNVLITGRKCPIYEELLHRIVWVAHHEGITYSILRKSALHFHPATTVRSFLCLNNQHLIENPLSDSEIDRLLINTGLADVVEMSKHDFNLPFSLWNSPNRATLSLRQLQKLCLARILFCRPTFCVLDVDSVEALSRKEWNNFKKSFLKRNIVVVRFSRFETDDIFTSPPKQNIEKNNLSKRDTLWCSVTLYDHGLLSEMPQMGDVPSPPRPAPRSAREGRQLSPSERQERSVSRRRSKSLHTDVVTESTFCLEMDEELIREINYDCSP